MAIGKEPFLAVRKPQTFNQPESIGVSAKHAKMRQGLKQADVNSSRPLETGTVSMWGACN